MLGGRLAAGGVGAAGAGAAGGSAGGIESSHWRALWSSARIMAAAAGLKSGSDGSAAGGTGAAGAR
jgi:hypothetical protein